MSYVPTSYENLQHEGDERFWGTLLQPGPGFIPSDIFPRFTDALFFYLDENAAPRRSGYIEPSKIVYWMNAVSSNKLESLDDVDAYNRIDCDVWGTPGRIVTAREGDPQAGKQIFILDRHGFMMDLLSSFRCEPEKIFNCFQASISLFRLLDPLTHQPFPPMPRSAIPYAADSEVVRLQARVTSRHQTQVEEQIQAAKRYYELLDRGQANALALIDGGYLYTY